MKTGIYWQDPKYALRPGRGFIRDPSLVLELPLYKLDGASFMSKDAYGHLCTVTGALWTPQGRLFDGSDDIINCGTSADLKPASAISIEVWIKVPTVAALGRVINCGAGAIKQGYEIYYNNDGTMIFLLGDGSLWQYAQSNEEIDDSAWHQIVGRWTASATLDIFIDGSEVTYSHQDSPVSWADSGVGFFVGERLSGTDALAGYIGEIRLYSRALNALEIQRNYLATKWRYK